MSKFGLGAVAAFSLALSACATAPAYEPATAPVIAADPVAVGEAAPAPAFSSDRLSEHIRVLSQDSFAGRFPGEVGEELTLNYLQAQYEAIGMEPGGPDGQWRQPVDLARYTLQDGGTASATANGTTTDLGVGANLVLRTPTAEGRAVIENAPVVFVGYGLTAPERNWDDYGDVDVRGAVVLYLGDQPTAPGFEEQTWYGSDSYKIAEAHRRGAVAAISLAELPTADPQWAGYLGYLTRPNMSIAGAQSTPVTGVMNLNAAQVLADGAGLDGQAAIQAADAAGFRAMRLEGVTMSAQVTETVEVIRSHNLLARITGSERPDEFVVYSAHWDHVGTTERANAAGDTIYNGAWDNASGTSALIEMARAFEAGPAPERTVIFLHVTAEEQGLLGSLWYAQHPVYPLERTAADINIDMLPFTPPSNTIAIFGPGKSMLEDDLARLAADQGRTLAGDGYPEEGFYYRSDHFNFAVGGVPALMPWTAVDFRDGGEAVGRPYYEAQMAAYYHNLEDEWRADYVWDAALENMDLLYRLGLEVADRQDWPQWKPTSEFAPIRARSDDQRR